VTRYLVWSLVDCTSAILLTAAAIGAADAHAWPLAAVCALFAVWAITAAYIGLDQWTQPKEHTP